jgi:hypothetical protein
MIATALLAAAGLLAATAAKADTIENVDLTFANGSTFVGTITFSSNFQSVVAADGTLHGYQNGTFGFTGNLSNTETVDEVFYGGLHVGNTVDGVILESAGFGLGGLEHNFITLDFNIADAPRVSLIFPNLTGVDGEYFGDHPADVNSGDSSITPTPEPGTILLLGSGLLGLAGVVRRKVAPARLAASNR